MRRYDDPVEVRQGWIGSAGEGMEGPEQFVWRGRLWQVRAVLAHWVETGAWWQSTGVRAVIGSDEPAAGLEVGAAPAVDQVGAAPAVDLLVERELWRVEARRGREDGGGVFDLSFDWNAGSWQLVGCAD
ncbi:MAG TPA: DUF6504 family protein [Nocardioides sp.]|uniref:DUF6504 family protein n=1 Tax=Nocardioides sp. TaxID=35761 RepID=UPI002C3CCD1F|nr:DUF6504 family protein [Nocardioides sp.]HQR25774.1 DUF6504 family protein [Nocardioides sp.]